MLSVEESAISLLIESTITTRRQLTTGNIFLPPHTYTSLNVSTLALCMPGIKITATVSTPDQAAAEKVANVAAASDVTSKIVMEFKTEMDSAGETIPADFFVIQSSVPTLGGIPVKKAGGKKGPPGILIGVVVAGALCVVGGENNYSTS